MEDREGGADYDADVDTNTDACALARECSRERARDRARDRDWELERECQRERACVEPLCCAGTDACVLVLVFVLLSVPLCQRGYVSYVTVRALHINCGSARKRVVLSRAWPV